jgi:hypothetical protein
MTTKYRTDAANRPLPTVSGMVNLFVGSFVKLSDNIFFSFVGGQTLLGIKPSMIAYLGQGQKVMARAAYIHVFNRGNTIKEDFNSLSIGFGFKIF